MHFQFFPQEKLEDVVGLKLVLRDHQALRPAGGCVTPPDSESGSLPSTFSHKEFASVQRSLVCPSVSAQSDMHGVAMEGATFGLCYQVQPLNAEAQKSSYFFYMFCICLFAHT